jgi:uncharacterized membrane protein YhaH (DUF805 family)
METASDISPAPPQERGLLSTAFTTKGRAGRLRYLIYLMSYCPLIMILGLFAPLYIFGIPLIVANYVCATVQRCHDIGLAGWWAFVLGLPGPNLALLVIPGRATNRYGDPPTSVRREPMVAAVMVLLTIGACSAYYRYTYLPAIQAYETRNAIIGGTWEKLTGSSPIAQLDFTAPTSGSITLDTGQRVPMTYRARYRVLYLSFQIGGIPYAGQLQHNLQSGQIEITDGEVIVGTYERR